MRKRTKFSLWLIVIYVFGCVVAGIALAGITLHLPKRPLGDSSAFQHRIHQQFNVDVEDVAIVAADKSILKGWFVQPSHPNGKAVILLHGITDNRIGISGYGDFFLAQGYSILLPDSREHGISGGAIATYGILERDDVHRWAVWLRQRSSGCTYLLGESMGAAIGLQASAVTPQLCAVAVESPYATFREISYDRMGWETHLGPFFWRTLGRPVIEVAVLYSRARYGIDLLEADPEAAVESSRVPTLLIAGTADRNIPPHHAQELEAACPDHCTLWLVSGADHGGASSVAPTEFQQRILNWFQLHGELAAANQRKAASTSL